MRMKMKSIGMTERTDSEYNEISQQVADQLEKKDFSPWHGAKNSLFEITPQVGEQFQRDI